MSSCKFTICSQKGAMPMQDPKKQQQPDDEDDTQSGQSHEKRQAGDNQGRLADGDQERQAGGNQEKQHHCQEKRQETVSLPSQCYDVIFQGDNVDKNVHVRDMRVDNLEHITVLIRML